MTREDRPPPGNPPTEAPADGAASASRREFFRAFSRQTVASAGSVVGAVAELRRTGSSAARELFSLGLDDPDASAARMSAAVASPTATAAPAATVGDPGFSSPYLVLEGSLRLLDVRQLPERNAFADCRHPSEVAAAIRSGVVNDGPVLAPIAAYALVMAIEATIERPDFSRQQAWGSAASALRSARPHVRALSWAIDRMERRYVMLGPTGDGGELLAGLRQEADAIAAGQALAHARLGSAGADALLDREAPTGQPPAAERRQMQLMMHGDMGPLSCGQVGTGGALVAALVAAGRDVHVWLTDALPSGEGRRLAALQLSRQDIASTSLPDSAVGQRSAGDVLPA
ncbi:MAG TPA: hypothetical protein VNW68_02405, partial [Candidatus Limnocylindria bacterium]|nr:hypothetical protein [Candidatus Limnocylindria bacterium]